MAIFTIKGKSFSTNGELPTIGSEAPDFKLTNARLKDKSLADFKRKKKIIYTVTSLDTDVCESTTQEFSQKFSQVVGNRDDVVLLVVSGDLPFAQSRVANEKNLQHMTTLSGMRSRNFAKDYGVLIQDGPLAGLMARTVTIIGEDNKVIYTEFVEEITNAPDYDKALAMLM